MLVPATALLSLLLFHRLIPDIAFCTKIPLAGCIFKESVKVRAAKSPPTTDDASLKLAPSYIGTNGSGIHTQNIGRLSQREKPISNGCGNGFFLCFSSCHQTCLCQ